MTTYSLTQVEALTGIRANTLRVWERRYNFMLPDRTKTNIRYYSDEQLRKLLNISILIKNGYRISKLSKMSDDDIHGLVNELSKSSSLQVEENILALTATMLEMNESAFDTIFQIYVFQNGFLSAVTELLYPFLQHIGVLWTTNKAVPAQEHFITNLIRQKIISAIEALPNPSGNAKRILLFLLEGENHDIGLLLANFIAKDLGWKVYYLGQNVPSENIKATVEIVKPELMMTMFITPRHKKMNLVIQPILDETGLPLIVSGNRDHLHNIELLKNVIYISQPKELSTFLSTFRK